MHAASAFWPITPSHRPARDSEGPGAASLPGTLYRRDDGRGPLRMLRSQTSTHHHREAGARRGVARLRALARIGHRRRTRALVGRPISGLHRRHDERRIHFLAFGIPEAPEVERRAVYRSGRAFLSEMGGI